MADTTPPPNSGPGETAARMKTVRDVKNDSIELVMDKPNVTAVGVGYKNRGQGGTTELAIVVSVEKKLPERDLRPEDRIPREVNGVPTDVVESGPFIAFAQTERMRPAQPGISIGNVQITAGTYGCMVTRGGQRLVLSNNHVLADANKAALGSIIVQPGIYDGGKTPADRIGVLQEFTEIVFDGATPTPPPTGCGGQLARLFGMNVQPPQPFNDVGNNKVDCALCKPDNDALISPDILGIGVPRGVALGTLGTAVTKSGRTTGLTTGEIEQIDVTSRVNYGGPIATFTGQLLAGAISKPGDSGSAVLDMNRNVIGLLFAGSDTSTLINPIQLVLDALKIEVVVAV